MNMAKQIQQAEAAIIRSMGVTAVFITHDNQHHPLNVLPKDDTHHRQTPWLHRLPPPCLVPQR